MCSFSWLDIVDFLRFKILDTYFLTDRNEDTRTVEVLEPPADSQCGDRVFAEGLDKGTPDQKLNPKKKIWEKAQVLSAVKSFDTSGFIFNILHAYRVSSSFIFAL